MKSIIEAMEFAAKKHEGQKRKDGTPYIYHPLRVARIVSEAGFGEKHCIVALLHDVLEDTDAEEDEIRKMFGSDILEAVKLVTRPDGMKEEVYTSQILEGSGLVGEMAAAVKNADKIHNLQDLPFYGNVGEKRTNQAFADRYLEKSRNYYQGKFSKALDKALEEAERQLADPMVHEKPEYHYTVDELRLYKAF